MNIYDGARSIALRRDLDAMSIYYEERSVACQRRHLKLTKPALPGLCFFFHGLILSDCEHFAIDFLSKSRKTQLCKSSDIVLQISARLPQNYIVRNSRIRGKWGPEENSSSLPFQLIRGKTFWMQVLLTGNSFYISVNGYHFARYGYRVPYKWLAAIDVRGDISDIVIDKFYLKEYPIRIAHSVAEVLPYVYDCSEILWLQSAHTMPLNWLRIDVPSKFLRHSSHPHGQLTLPFYGRMPVGKKLIAGYDLRIEGRVRLMPESFSVALQLGQNIWPQPTVSLLFNPCFLRSSRAKVGKAIITRSAFINGVWIKRKVTRLHTDLGPGKAFVIVIACQRQYYEVFVNGKSLLAFKHQMNPAIIDMVNIRGDIKLWNVVVESNRESQVFESDER